MSIIDYQKKAYQSMLATRMGLILLMAVIAMSTLWLVPTHKKPSWIICILSLLPLLIILPWLLKKNIKAHIWLCFILLGYFMNAVQNAFIPQYGWLPYVEIGLLVWLFSVSMLFARWQQRSMIK